MSQSKRKHDGTGNKSGMITDNHHPEHVVVMSLPTSCSDMVAIDKRAGLGLNQVNYELRSCYLFPQSRPDLPVRVVPAVTKTPVEGETKPQTDMRQSHSHVGRDGITKTSRGGSVSNRA